MLSAEKNFERLFLLKRRILASILVVLTLSILTTVLFIALKLHSALVEDSRQKTNEIATTINSNLQHMMELRSPKALQETLLKVVEQSDTVTRAFILNNQGRIVYSSDPGRIGESIDRTSDPACVDCHLGESETISRDSIVLDDDSTQRNITVIYNQESCHACHPADQRINGKLIIDRSLAKVDALIGSIELILFGSGALCLIIVVPLFWRLLSKGIDQYIHEIITRNKELHLLYVMVGRLGETLDMNFLRETIVEIFRDVLEADDVELVLPRGENDYSASAWSQEKGEMDRKKIDSDDPMAPVLQLWLDGLLLENEVSNDGRMIAMPVVKGEQRFALIVARKDSRFNPERLKLSEIIRSHIEAAFENARLYYMAITDELTRTYTKRHFRTSIDQQFDTYTRYGSKFSLLMLDLDHFKSINDTHGHVTGDSVLRKLGKIICLELRDHDLAFRYGGEEFAVILPDTDIQGARLVAERIRSTVEGTIFEPEVGGIRLTVSIGISTCAEAESVRDVIVAADKALYDAKNQGRNRIIEANPAVDC